MIYLSQCLFERTFGLQNLIEEDQNVSISHTLNSRSRRAPSLAVISRHFLRVSSAENSSGVWASSDWALCDIVFYRNREKVSDCHQESRDLQTVTCDKRISCFQVYQSSINTNHSVLVITECRIERGRKPTTVNRSWNIFCEQRTISSHACRYCWRHPRMRLLLLPFTS